MAETRLRVHRLIPMTGRDPYEENRASTPLELLFDLTFVVAISVTGDQTGHLLSAGHTKAALLGFVFAMFACIWPWINFSWFASAYDTDDWYMRVATMVQMAGVLVMALGLPEMFAGLEHGMFSNRVMVAGYVVMRVGMIALWIRAGMQDLRHRDACFGYAKVLAVAQVGWTLQAIFQPRGPFLVVLMIVLYTVEIGGVYMDERKQATPWHADHIAERYGLLTIITLGEVVLGTMAAIRALVDTTGWSVDAVLVAIAGVSLTFGLWWVYFVTPYAEVLARRTTRVFGWGYGHFFIYLAVAGVGIGLHLTADYASKASTLSLFITVLCLVVPLGVFIVAVFALFHYLLPGRDRFHFVLVAATVGVAAAGLAAAAAGLPLAVCLAILTLTPWVVVVGYEVRGHGHLDRVLAKLDE